MNIVFYGPEGSGKGTQASLLAKELKIPHLVSGDLVRKYAGEDKGIMGEVCREALFKGHYVADSEMYVLWKQRFKEQDASEGWVLDGFPRTRGQAQGLDHVLKQRRRPLDGAVYLAAPLALLVRRLSGRRVCPRCGAIYHVRTMKPKRAGLCDRDRERLAIRKDDEPRTIRKRLLIDRAASKSLLAYYRRQGVLYRINGAGPLDDTFDRMRALCVRRGWLGR